MVSPHLKSEHISIIGTWNTWHKSPSLTQYWSTVVTIVWYSWDGPWPVFGPAGPFMDLPMTSSDLTVLYLWSNISSQPLRRSGSDNLHLFVHVFQSSSHSIRQTLWWTEWPSLKIKYLSIMQRNIPFQTSV